MDNIIAKINKEARARNLASFDNKAFALTTWFMYMGADIAESGSKDLEGMLRKIGSYTHEHKQSIEKIKTLCRNMVRDVDTQFELDFACDFAEIADEVQDAVKSILLRRMKSLQDG